MRKLGVMNSSTHSSTEHGFLTFLFFQTVENLNSEELAELLDKKPAAQSKIKKAADETNNIFLQTLKNFVWIVQQPMTHNIISVCAGLAIAIPLFVISWKINIFARKHINDNDYVMGGLSSVDILYMSRGMAYIICFAGFFTQFLVHKMIPKGAMFAKTFVEKRMIEPTERRLKAPEIQEACELWVRQVQKRDDKTNFVE